MEEVIKSDIENRYKKYFNQLILKKFSFSAREEYFRQVKIDLNNIDTTIDKIYFLKIIYFAVSSPDFISKIEGLRKNDFVNYKNFIKEKYDLISQIDCENHKLISFAISLFEIDAPILDELLKKNMYCIDSDYSVESPDIYSKKTILGVEYTEKVRRRENNWFKNSEINNIHICIFKILSKMAKDKQTISQLVNLINDKISQNIIFYILKIYRKKILIEIHTGKRIEKINYLFLKSQFLILIFGFLKLTLEKLRI